MRLFTCALLIAFSSQGLFAQQDETLSPVVTRLGDKVELGLNLSYYRPSLDNVNSVFAQQEQVAHVTPSRDFDIFYLTSVSFRYHMTPLHSLAVEIGASVLQREQNDLDNAYRLYTVGLEYRYIIMKRTETTPDVYAGLGGGWILTNFFREYPNDIAISLLKDSWYANVCAGASYMFTSHFGGELECRYMLVPTISTNIPTADVKLSSATIGVGLVVKP